MLANADVTTEAEQSLKRISKEKKLFSTFKEQTSLEKGVLNNISHNDSSFPDVIDTHSCCRSHWQQIFTYEKTDLDVEVIEDPDNKYFCLHYAKNFLNYFLKHLCWASF